MACARVPLDEQQVTEPGPLGKEHTLPALHPDRKEERCFVPYKPPAEDGSPAEVEEFLEYARFILEDLEWLLALPHDKFWCQLSAEARHKSEEKVPGLVPASRPRGLDLAALPSSPAVAEMQRSIHRMVFLTFLRMATHKESKDNFFTPDVFGEIIYENFLFDIPKILDLDIFKVTSCVNFHVLSENIFTQQPSYYSDLDETVPTVLQVFDSVLDKCGLQCEGATAMEPMKLNAHQQPTAMTMSQQELADIILYLCDSTTTIHAFLDIFPAACSTFHSYGFLSRLTSFYETTVPDLEKAVRKRNFDDKGLQDDLWKRLSHSCRKMVETSHLLLHHTCLQPILEGFLADYDEQFPLSDDISLLQQALPVIDETRTSYLLQGVASAWDSVGRRKPQNQIQAPKGPASFSASQGAVGGAGTSSSTTFKPQEVQTPAGGEGMKGAEAMVDIPRKGNNGAVCPLSGPELDSLLSCIRDLLPDLGEGFLLACLEEYDYNSELVINTSWRTVSAQTGPAGPVHAKPRVLFLLDTISCLKLWTRLLNTDMPVKEELPNVLSNRSNVFDDDEFDVFRRKGKGENVREMLNDKQHVAEQRARYQAYETVVDEVIIEPGESAEAYGLDDYDDEYDDTYDMNQVGANDLDGDSLLNRRPFTVPQVLRKGNKPEEEEEDEDEEEEETLQRTSNVVGRPKGQGQTLDTFLDRRKKEANKSRVSNHNRRTMADRKRNKGMIPS
ncbi:hypothetical protein INR49_018201 [Caranx melampygus]|nr:hypothetical protein INR49_018201 [Caranx melampygus]